MLAFVAVTFYHKEVSQDPPGVVTRWWDGTLQSVEHKYSNGQLADRTVYGDDGKTVIEQMQWSATGGLMRSIVRQKSGHVEEKHFQRNGTLSRYKLWLGDMRLFVIERTYYDNGQLEQETLYTEDGLVPAETRSFSQKGQLEMERKVLDNADQRTDFYRQGKLTTRHIFKANGDTWEEMFYDNGALQLRSKSVRLNGDIEKEGFSKAGKLVFKQTGSFRKSVREVYDAQGKVRIRQHLTSGLTRVEEISVETGKVTREFVIDEDRGILGSIRKFRPDGTLELVKKLEVGDVVVKTTEYDASGTKIVKEKDGGEAESYNPEVFFDELQLLYQSEKGGN